MLHDNLAVNEKGHLTICGADTVELAEKYGTPLYVIDEEKIREKCRAYRDSMEKFFGGNSRPMYASKALCFKKIYNVISSEGMCADVVSMGEIYTALSGGMSPENLFFHGNNKTADEISYAMDNHVGYFIADNYEELDRIDRMAGERGMKQKILLRITLGIDSHTLEAINTGKVDCQFGVPVPTGQAAEFVGYALEKQNIELCGYHSHIGSQVFDPEPFKLAMEMLVEFIFEMRSKYGYTAKMLDIGGGLAVRYIESDPVIDIPYCIEKMAGYVKEKCRELSVPMPDVLMEPGRSIVADAGLTLYSVGSIKTINGHRSYVTIDGGMTDNPRYALYKSDYTVLVANRAEEPGTGEYTVAGRCCESGALIQENVFLPSPEAGDILAVLVTGAYNFSMASNYNRVCRPAVVMVNKDGDYLAVRRETVEDLTACDL